MVILVTRESPPGRLADALRASTAQLRSVLGDYPRRPDGDSPISGGPQSPRSRGGNRRSSAPTLIHADAGDRRPPRPWL